MFSFQIQNPDSYRLSTCDVIKALGRMSSLTLPAVILGEGKSLIPKPGQTGFLSLGGQPV